MTDLPIAQTLHRAGHWTGEALICTLDYDGRFLRRKRLVTQGGTAFVVDLAHTTSLDHGDALELTDGTLVQIEAAPEELLAISGAALARVAWHIGNRHTPCQVEPERLLIQRDAVIRHMLEHLGADISEVMEPFTPEGGAYGHGRTHAHDHGATAHDHEHEQGHGHSHAH